jgi:uncharacterized membrane protein YfcA
MQEVIIFIVALVAGFLGATVGGGGMIAIPTLLFLGFPPQVAVALNKVGDVGAFISAVNQYWKSKKIDWPVAIPLALVVIVGSVIGAQIMVSLKTDVLEIMIGVMILLYLPFFFFNKKLGLKQTNPSKTKKTIGFILYALLAVEGAIIGAGGGTVILIIMMYFFGYEIVRGYATNTPAEIFSALIPAIIYGLHGFIPLVPAVVIFTGMLIGGFVGAHTAIKKGNLWVKNLLTVVILASVIKILFF